MPDDIWTEERTNELSKYIEKGLSSREIGDKMGLTRNAVIGKAYRLRLTLQGDAGRKPDPNRVVVIRQKRKPPTPIRVLPPLRTDCQCTMLGLRGTPGYDQQCRFICDEVRGIDTIYCGAPTRQGHSFCPTHQEITHYIPDVQRHAA